MSSRGLFVALCVACSPENGLKGSVEQQEYAAHLEVYPTAIEFGALDQGDSATERITLSSTGDATLLVDAISIEGSGAFSLAGADEELSLAPGDSADIYVTYTSQRQDDEGEVRIESSDPDQPVTGVELAGEGLFPAITITPDPYDLGEHLTGCGAFGGELTITNTGEGVGTVSQLTMLGGSFQVTDAPELPLTLAPGEEATVGVQLDPGEDGDWEGTLYVRSDDPAGDVSATLSATTMTQSDREIFRQGVWPQTDVLLTVDRSCSMDDDAARLSEELPTLFTALDATETDFQLAVVTEDSGCYNETLFTKDTDDAEDVFHDAIFGDSGTWTEAGFTLALNAIKKSVPGSCNDGLLREDALVTVLNVSDEPEQSGPTWDEMVADILDLAPTTVISAVAGPVPGGCATAMAGEGYLEASEATGGFFADFCDVDWSDVARKLANLTGTPTTNTFVLDGTPWPETLEVEIDHVPATGWTYDADLNAIVFDVWPEDGAGIGVTYDYGVCDETSN